MMMIICIHIEPYYHLSSSFYFLHIIILCTHIGSDYTHTHINNDDYMHTYWTILSSRFYFLHKYNNYMHTHWIRLHIHIYIYTYIY